MRLRGPLLALGVILGSMNCPAWVPAQEPASNSPQNLEFFEKRIRPALAQHCYACHHPDKKIKGGLRLDTRDGWAAGGDSGAALEPGKPEESLLLEAIRYDSSLKMPPSGKLPAEVIADFERWIQTGAADPRVPGEKPRDTKPAAGLDLEAGRKFWSFQPPRSVEPPVVQNAQWPRGEIDRFILAALEAKGLSPAADADRATLCRRLHYDLTGLPPTPEETDAFVNDTAPDAYSRLVDKLLASPQFGEHWGRHWLDVARFAESLTLRGFVFKEAWRYRDYAIQSFNQDRPFNRFLVEQIAGDLLPAASLEDRQRQLIATAYLTLGNTNLEEQDKGQLRMDVVDEQLDTIGKGMLGQTIGCARCHDHKFDPIPTRDYYAMAGILRSTTTLEHANVSNWLELPLPLPPAEEAVHQQQEQAVAALKEKIKQSQTELAALTKDTQTAEIVATSAFPGILVDDAQAKKVGEWKDSQHSGRYIGAGYTHDLDQGKGTKTLTFQPALPQAGKYEVRLAYTPGGNRADKVPVTVFSADGEKTTLVNEQVAPPIEGRFVSLGQHRFEQNGQGFVIVSNEDTKGHVIADAVQFLLADGGDVVAKPVETPMPKDSKADSVAQAVSAAKQEIKRLEAEMKQLTDKGPKRPVTMSVREDPAPADTAIHIRGSVHNLGPIAPRGFLQVASNSPATISSGQSGRLEFGEWIARNDNPLTARVMANRTWHWLFGTGLVRTTDNFGTTGELPSHPELLDALALKLVSHGWSVKALVREIVLSRTYQQSSVAANSQAGSAADPENRLLWHMNRRRLDAESLRDSLLMASGQLDLTAGGSTIKPGTAADYGYVATELRRSVYLPVFRNAMPEMLEVFDVADPSTVTGRRNTSTVAPQALFLMNSPFLLQQSQATARRILKELPQADIATRLMRAYRLILGRAPTAREVEVAANFLNGASASAAASTEFEEKSWSQLVQTLFASLDFRHVK